MGETNVLLLIYHENSDVGKLITIIMTVDSRGSHVISKNLVSEN